MWRVEIVVPKHKEEISTAQQFEGKKSSDLFQRKNILRLKLFCTCSTDKVVEAVEPEVSKTDALEEWCEDELESRCLVVLMNIARIANAVQVTL